MNRSQPRLVQLNPPLPTPPHRIYREHITLHFALACGLLLHTTLAVSRQNLVRVGSAILSPDARLHWEMIQHSEGGTAALLRHFEEYANTLAQNMRKTYLSPFTFVTPHIGEL